MTDVLSDLIKKSVQEAIREELAQFRGRRLYTIEETAGLLTLSQAEVYSMTASGDLPVVTHGRRKMVDIQDINTWIERNKT